MIKTIVCTGDSHTWGQGATGAEQSQNPPAEGGDLRLVSFKYGCYVNLLRKMVCEQTDSECFEFETADLTKTANLPLSEGCVKVTKSINLELDAELIRIEFKKQKTPSSALVYLDGILCEKVDLQTENAQFGFYGFKTVCVFCPSGTHTLEIKSDTGSVLIYRIEAYKGEYAIINSGIGSCPTLRFMEEYWADYVECYRPKIVLMEAHTINDWLTKCSPDEYRENLIQYIKKIKQLNAVTVMLTVSPILGDQGIPTYDEFIKVSKHAARMENIDIADANREMKHHLAGLIEEDKFKLMFSDNWHVNDFGHEFYAKCSLNKIWLLS